MHVELTMTECKLIEDALALKAGLTGIDTVACDSLSLMHRLIDERVKSYRARRADRVVGPNVSEDREV